MELSTSRPRTRSMLFPCPTVRARFRSVLILARDVHDRVLANLCPRDIFCFALACTEAREAVLSYMLRVYNVNLLLRRFFDDPLAFRRLQRSTGTLVSGSAALQFMDRTVYPESDLDIYTHPGHAQAIGHWLVKTEGYAFLPTEGQTPRCFDSDTPSFPWRTFSNQADLLLSPSVSGCYRSQSIDAVYSFERTRVREETTRVQIVSARNSPLHCILSFHSSQFHQDSM
jgi:hypothetical protein